MKYPVAITKEANATYPSSPPFHPSVAYPECPIPSVTTDLGGNPVYDAVRRLFRLLDLDPEHRDTPAWNPLGHCVKPGHTVFIKPNMIAHKHALNDDWQYVITHGSVLRATLDYVLIALKGEGRILIGDAPQTDSHFDRIVSLMGLPEIVDLYRSHTGVDIELLDLRDEHWVEKDGIYVETVALPGDPRGGVEIDLAGHSMFAEFDGMGKQYYGAYYDTAETNRHHCDGRHEYAISRSPIEADVFINVPKLKTHKKCGLTVNLKSLVGINANKNWLPHYCIGAPDVGGDQFPAPGMKGRIENRLVLAAKRGLVNDSRIMKFAARKLKGIGYRVFGSTEEVVRSGNWHGNDTVWRMCVDLNRILMFGEPDGGLREAERPKPFFSVVDGFVAMEGNGPVAGTPVAYGVVIGGANPVSVDAVCARLMGLDVERLPLIARAMEHHRYPLYSGDRADIAPVSDFEPWNRPVDTWPHQSIRPFRPHFGWVGEVELQEE